MQRESLEIEKLIRDAVGETLTLEAVDAYCRKRGVAFRDVCNAMALAVARRFNASLMTYPDADAAMSALFGAMARDATRQGDGFEFPEPAFAIYLAFDAGEYTRRDGADPVERYTRPLVKKALRDA